MPLTYDRLAAEAMRLSAQERADLAVNRYIAQAGKPSAARFVGEVEYLRSSPRARG